MSAAALAYGLARYRDGAAGKTLLVGWRDGEGLFAIAAGLGGAGDRERFAVLARYLLRRDRADGYWLLFAADLDRAEHLAAEVVSRGRRHLLAAPLLRDADGAPAALGSDRGLDGASQLGDLLDGGAKLPALMRRELDRLGQTLAVAAP